MNKALDGMSRALFDSDLIASRLALFLAEALWAIMLFWPGDTFGRPTYSEMAKLAPEIVWACAFGISAALQICIVIYRQCNKTWAHIFAYWNAALWVTSILLMLKGVYPPPAAIGGEIALATSALWIAVRPCILAKGERRAAAAAAAML
jgi:hypothetical protein